MPGRSSISREHRARVLKNQTRIAAERIGSDQDRRDPQLKIPLIVEVKRSANAKQPARRTRRKSETDQPDLGKL